MSTYNLLNKPLSYLLPENLLNIEEKKRGNVFNWRGQFSPQLVEYILSHYASKSNIVFDPFLGSGTTLLEGARLGLESYGCEINPAAHIFSKIYEFCNINISRREEYIYKLENKINSIKRTAERDDTFLKELINLSAEGIYERYILEALIVSLNIGLTKFSFIKFEKVWESLKNTITILPLSSSTIKSFNCDSRRTILPDNFIDIVVTSPPYINVFNYHQNYRKSVEALGWDVLEIAKSEIGANRKFRSNRFMTVIQYCLDMMEVFIELSRVCKNDAKIIFVVGRESNVCKTKFYNSNIILEIAKCSGFDLINKKERFYKNKFGQIIYEDVVFLQNIYKALDYETLISKARNIGIQALELSCEYAPAEQIDLIKQAILKSKTIMPSPIINGDMENANTTLRQINIPA